MAEARRILEYPHALPGKAGIIGAGDGKYHFFVRNSRRNDPHVHTPFGRKAQRPAHFVGDDQVRCSDIQRLFRLSDQIQIDIFRRALLRQRVIVEGLHEPLRRYLVTDVEVACEVLVFLGRHVPQLKKRRRQAPDRLALQPKAGVLPHPVGPGTAKVFIRKVVAADIAHLAVDDRGFPVIPVVQKQIDHRHGRVEHPAADAVLAQPSGETQIYKAKAADVVVHQPHLDPLTRLAYQNFPYLLKGRIVRHDEIFHEDEFLGLFQIRFHGFQGLGSVAKIADAGIFVHRPVFMDGKIVKLVAGGAVFRFQPCQNRPVLGKAPIHFLPETADTLPRPARVAQNVEQQKQAQAHHRSRQNQHDPRHFHGSRSVSAVQAKHHHDAQQVDARGYPSGVGVQLHRHYDQPDDLNDNGQPHERDSWDTVAFTFVLSAHSAPPFSFSSFSSSNSRQSSSARRWFSIATSMPSVLSLLKMIRSVRMISRMSSSGE